METSGAADAFIIGGLYRSAISRWLGHARMQLKRLSAA
jgi:hypothetical protein